MNLYLKSCHDCYMCILTIIFNAFILNSIHSNDVVLSIDFSELGQYFVFDFFTSSNALIRVNKLVNELLLWIASVSTLCQNLY